VVIAIISLLSSVVLTALGTSRSKARDAQRISDMNQVRNAIELYMLDHAGVPPSESYPYGAWSLELNNTYSVWTPKNDLAPKYISKVPEDPLSPSAPIPNSEQYGYWYYYQRGAYFNPSTNTLTITNNNKDYAVCTKLENPTISFTDMNGAPINYCVGSVK